MTATTLPRDKRTLIGLLETAFKKTNETEIGEIILELGPHVDSLKREIMIDGRKGETVTVSLMYTDWIADDDKDTKTPRMIKGQWPIRNQWPVEAGCRIAQLLGIPDDETARVVEKCLEGLDAHAKFDTMASIVTFLTRMPSLGLVVVTPDRCRGIKTYRLNRVNRQLVAIWEKTVERYAEQNTVNLEFRKTA